MVGTLIELPFSFIFVGYVSYLNMGVSQQFILLA